MGRRMVNSCTPLPDRSGSPPALHASRSFNAVTQPGDSPLWSEPNPKELSVSDYPQMQPTPTQPVQSGLSDNAAGGLAYVTIIPAIIFLIVEPYNRNSYVRFHAWQSIFMGIAAVAVQIVLSVIPVIGWIIIPFFALGFFILWIIVLLKALKGQRFMIPVIGKFAAQQAGA
jgi:uncharacterized membrane protein